MRLCQSWALFSERLKADAVELSLFPELADRFRVTAVPTVLLRGPRGDATLAGPLPEPVLLARIARLAAGDPED